MTSLRGRLFVILVLATGAIWLCATAWILVCSRAELTRVLDARLQEAARMIHSLVANGNMTVAHAAAAAAAADAAAEPALYTRQLSCQIWSFDGRLVGRSVGAPDSQLTDQAAGFSDRQVDGETWRVYAVEDPAKGFRVMVGDRISLRQKLVNDLLFGLLAPGLVVIPALGALIWLSLGRGLRPLAVMAGELAARRADDVRPIETARTPAEVRPLAVALNGLMDKVEAARRHERDVTAFAAHELRTPLAGLKTQAQIARAASDPAIRAGALGQIIVSVDRMTALVRQLLALARLEAGGPGLAVGRVTVGEVLREIDEHGALPARTTHVVIDPALDRMVLTTERESLSLALRNLHENALHHTPGGGTVTWTMVPGAAGIVVRDEGQGIPDEDLGLVRRRFYRGRHSPAAGTGLGLTIVETAARRLGARLELRNRTDRPGLEAALLWLPGGPGPSAG